jgi:hypothetical protein
MGGSESKQAEQASESGQTESDVDHAKARDGAPEVRIQHDQAKRWHVLQQEIGFPESVPRDDDQEHPNNQAKNNEAKRGGLIVQH